MTKEIPLTQGKVALVDDADYEYLVQWKWHYHVSGYAARAVNPRKMLGMKMVFMHREIMQPPHGMEVDHKNGNRLDYRRENLRVCTHAQNMANMKKSSSNTTGYKGVSWWKAPKKYVASIRVNGRLFILGYFDDPIEAARAYDQKAKEVHGEFARTNF